IGHRSRSPTLVGHLELRGRADREGGDDLEAECRRVVVVDEEDDVRLVVLQPLAREVVTREDLLPVRFLGLAQVHCRADGRHVRGIDGCGDARHGYFLPHFGSRPPPTIMSRYCSSLMPVIEPAICWKLLPSVAPIFARK